MKLKKIYNISIVICFILILKYIFSCTPDILGLNDYINQINMYVEADFMQYIFPIYKLVRYSPIGLMTRWININWFGYSAYFDLVLGAVGLFSGAAVIGLYIFKQDISIKFGFIIILSIFSLNKWEMLINGTGYLHFWAFAAFWLHFYFLDEWYMQKRRTLRNKYILIILPIFTILTLAMFYGLVYSIVVSFCLVIIIVCKKRKKESIREDIIFLISVDIPMIIYTIVSIIENNTRVIADGSIIQNFLKEPLFFIRFFVASFSSEVVGIETILKISNGMNIAYILGIGVIFIYFMSFYYNISMKIYERTLMPLLLLTSGILNHMIVVYSRWGFHSVSYSMSSRYGLQYLSGVLGIVITMAIVFQNCKRVFAHKVLIISSLGILIAGNSITTYQEIVKAPYRMAYYNRTKNMMFTYDEYSDEALEKQFVSDATNIRRALALLKESGLSVWKEIGNDLEHSYVLEGMYDDDWLAEEARFIMRTGEVGEIEIECYCPELTNEDSIIEVLVNDNSYLFEPEKGKFDLLINSNENEYVDIKIKANWVIQSEQDMREKSFVLVNMQCK